MRGIDAATLDLEVLRDYSDALPVAAILQKLSAVILGSPGWATTWGEVDNLKEPSC